MADENPYEEQETQIIKPPQEPSESDPTLKTGSEDGQSESEPTKEEDTTADVPKLRWSGSIVRMHPAEQEIRHRYPRGIVHPKHSRRVDGHAYNDHLYGAAMFFPNPDTYPLGGYFAGEEIES